MDIFHSAFVDAEWWDVLMWPARACVAAVSHGRDRRGMPGRGRGMNFTYVANRSVVSIDRGCGHVKRSSLYCPQDRGCGHVPNSLRANRAYATRLSQRHHTIIPP